MDSNISFAFDALKPLCDRIAKDCSLEDILEFERIIKQIDDDSIRILHTYVLVSFRLLLCRKAKEAVIIKAADVMSYLFEKGPTGPFPVFSRFFLQLSQLLLNPVDMHVVINASEEFKISVCKCVISLVKNSDEEVIKDVYQYSFRLVLAQAVFSLINLLKNEKSKMLRKTVLQTIGVLALNSNHISIKSKAVKQSASTMLAEFLPGLSIALISVICGDVKQGEAVVRISLNILAELIVLVVGDGCTIDAGKNKNTKTKDDGVIKNETWFKETSAKLEIVVNNSTTVVSHDNWKVRLEFLMFAKSILFHCTKYLENCVSILLPSIFALSVDPYSNIASSAQNLISEYSHCIQSSKSMSLYSIITENIYSSTLKLIKSKLASSDDQKLVILRSIQGYVQILGDSICGLLLSANHLEKLVMSLASLLEFDTSMISVVEEISTQWEVPMNSNSWPQKRFLYFKKDEILTTICNICHCLGQSKYKQLLIDFLIEKLHSSELFLLQFIFLIGNIVEGFMKSSGITTAQTDLIKEVLEELLSPALWDVSEDKETGTVQIFQSESNTPNPVMYSNNKLCQICLILESIAKCAKTLGIEFRSFLMKVLFNVMEAAGSSNYILAQSGRLCLFSISQSCGYDSILELIRENADYIINSISINFHHFFYRPEMIVVLRVVIEESDAAVLPLFTDSISQILHILDLNQDKAYPLLIVLKSVAVSIRKWFPPKEKSIPSSLVSSEDLKMYFLRKKTSKEDLENSVNSEKADETEEADDFTSDDRKKDEPLYIKMLSNILKHCYHLQSSRNIYVQVISLEIMEICIIALGDFELVQHPLVHELWNPFIHRFSEDKIVMLRAFKVLLVIADECRDFVRQRALKDVVPKLTLLLKTSYSSSLLKNNFRSYQWTNSCKLQLSVLSNIGDLFCKLDVSRKDIALLAEVCVPYLQNEQPKVFQAAAFQTLEALATIHADAVWWYINQAYSPQPVLEPPHKSLYPIHFPHAKTTNFEFKLNF
ncbi:TELO2-interacting protein 1 [Trichonephila clavata]|uniref:TELO2-interacting protein 1 n=1 Tax=Trichonephila clavata TaxID=2740835 RepID=A0A8X6K5V2_TRICU|nr:TELO2-interacting protein 1 [Trichonephila clavata]